MAIIGMIFDFDDTLVPDSTTQFLRKHGVDPKVFWEKEVKDLVLAGYDPTTAYLKSFLDKVGEGKPLGLLTNTKLHKFGKEIESTFYPGIEDLIKDSKKIVKKFKKIEIEFYIVSGGLLDIIEGCRLVKKYFSGVYACQLAGDFDGGVLKYIKRSISFTEKTRYIFEINKGIPPEDSRKNPYLVNTFVPKTDRRIQLCNMIYVGDGLTDIPCFSLLLAQEIRGLPFGVFNPEDEESAKRALIEFLKPDRVISMHAPKYRKNDELGSLLRAAIAGICNRILISEQLARKIN